VRRLRHLQHLCQRVSARLPEPNGNDSNDTMVLLKVVRHLLAHLHPTPAVCGFPAVSAMAFIREKESIGFDVAFTLDLLGTWDAMPRIF
jgi:isochorismate synthase EntC